MTKFKLILLTSTLTFLFACTSSVPKKKARANYLKDNISQAELSNATHYKRYFYSCSNLETGANSHLSTYFPLSKESRLKDNFGFYFQLDGGKVEPLITLKIKRLMHAVLVLKSPIIRITRFKATMWI